jgi:regulator of protease activity HflC (stomatin/prohibitin superfamily)
MIALKVFAIAFVISFIAWAIVVPAFIVLCRVCGLFTIVEEGRCKVYVLFGKVLGVLNEPGLYFLPSKLGVPAFIVHIFGKCYDLDMRLDQEYLRSQPVNSEEGAPMGLGVWYEMSISDPVAYLFKNADPRGSLGANVSNSTVRCLSNLPLDRMLENRHSMSATVREEVSPKSNQWGYTLGSVYIRKVHFRDENMIHQIEEKVVNRLRQVTAAIRQAGANQVNIIASTAERQAAVAFAKAAAMRPRIVGEALQEISKDKEVSAALFNVLEVQNILESGGRITIIPRNNELLAALVADKSVPEQK